MAAFNFPNSPSTNELHTENGVTYKWNGTVWKRQNASYTDATNLNVTGISTLGGNVTIGGVLTYEDVKNVDSVGIISARTAIHVGAGISAVGIITGTSFRGDGSQLTGVASTEFVHAQTHAVVGMSTLTGPVSFGNTATFKVNQKLYFNDGADNTFGSSYIYGDNYNLIVKNHNAAGSSYFSGSTCNLQGGGGNKTGIRVSGSNGDVEFFHNNSIIGETHSNGQGGIDIKESLRHYGDLDTKLVFGTDTISFQTAGSERLSIKSDGSIYTVTQGAKFGISQDPTLTTMGATSGTWQVPEVDGSTIGAEMRIGDHNTNSTALIRLASYGSGDGGVGGGAIMFTNTRCGSASHHSDLAAIKGARESLGKGYLRFFTASSAANTEKMRITSDGALLIGTTSPYYASGDMQHEIKKNNSRTYTAPLMTGHSHLFLHNSDTTDNAFTGLGFRTGSGDGAIGYVYRGSANNSDFVINTDGNANGVERLRVFNNGSVLIGALSGEAAGGSSSGGSARLVIDCEGLNIYNGVGNAANYGLVFANDYNSNYANGIGFFNDGGTSCGGYIVHQDKGSNNIGDLVFATSATADTPVERVRIKSNGEVDVSDNVVIHSVGNSQAVDIEQQTDGNYMNIRLRNFYTGSAKNMMAFLDQNGNVRGSIVINNSSTTYNTTSDYRLKENEVPISDGIERLKLLKPYRFNWKDDPSITLDGFFAHEVTPAVPEAIVNEKDGEIDEEGNGYQQMDYAKITPLLTAALQEAIAEIETLKTEVAALKSA